MSVETDEPLGPSLRLIGMADPESGAADPAEGAPSLENELAASNRAARAYSHRLVSELIGGFTIGDPGELLAGGQAPSSPTIGPGAVEAQLLHVPVGVQRSGETVAHPHRFASAGELVACLDAGAVVTAPSIGKQVPYLRRLREHLGRWTRTSCTVELAVLGCEATAPVETGTAIGGVVLVDGEVDLEGPAAASAGVVALKLGAAVTWHDVGALSLRGMQRWNAVLILRLDQPAGVTQPTAVTAARCAPVPSSSVVSVLAERPLRVAGPEGRADIFVRSVAPGGLVVVPDTETAAGIEFFVAGHHYGATPAGVRAVAMIHAGPCQSLRELDRLLGSPAAADGFVAQAMGGGWLEYAKRGDLLT